MPLLFSLARHAALVATQEQLRSGEFLFAFLDDIYRRLSPGQSWRHSRDLAGGTFPPYTHFNSFGEDKSLEQRRRRTGSMRHIAGCSQGRGPNSNRLERRPNLPVALQGVKILGTPVGHEAFVVHKLAEKTAAHSVLLGQDPPSRTYKQLGFSSCSALQRKPTFS